MDRLVIQGGEPLFGQVDVAGAKNAALPIMAASLLIDGRVELNRVPRLGDVATMAALVSRLGADVQWIGHDALSIVNDPAGPCRAPYALVRRMRAGVCVLGPLLARRGKAAVPLPGGCRLGDRPIDLHLRGLAALGADVRIVRGSIVASARRLRGARIDLVGPRGPTVTGTANVLCAAALAQGSTLLTGAAVEPEISDLGGFLNAAGARIEGLGTPRIEIEGVADLCPTRWKLIPDRIEAATLLMAGCITRGVVAVGNLAPDSLSSLVDVLTSVGVCTRIGADQITVDARGPLRAVDVVARPFPGLPTDVLPQLAALLSIARGTSRVRDTVFPERFGHVAELARLGARICRAADRAEIEGVCRLQGAPVTAPDLRAGAALVLAGLAASGRTTLSGLQHLDRGYERLETKLVLLGARVERHGGSRQFAAAWEAATLESVH